MENSLINQVMQFVRRDGPASPPVCFLTIEDGGVLKQTAFDDYIKGASVWVPNKDLPLTKNHVGLPGEFISKIMTYAFHDLINCSEWEEYRARKLYRENECNIKYYPIGRHDTGVWEPWLQERLGITASEYKAQCQSERPQIIYEQCQSCFSSATLFIMLGALDEWSYFLRKYVCDDYSLILANGQHSEFAIPPIANTAFAYYPIFKWGYRNDEKIHAFSEEIRKQATEKMLAKIAHSTQSQGFT